MSPRLLLGLAGIGAATAAALSVFAVLTWPSPDGRGGKVIGVADIGGPFALTDTQSRTVTEQDLLGKPTAIFFGFTFCPDVCPTTLFELSNLMDEMGAEAERLNVVFVSVDWERDGPAEMASYLSAFDGRIRGFTGTEDQIAAVTKAYRVFYARVPTEDGYTIDHTASVFLMDEAGHFAGTLAYGESHDVALAKLRRLAKGA